MQMPGQVEAIGRTSQRNFAVVVDQSRFIAWMIGQTISPVFKSH